VRETTLDTQEYQRLLLAEEQRLSGILEQKAESARASTDETVKDWSDDGASDESEGEVLAEADTESKILKQVRDALKRIENGTFGKCLADGRQIPEKRLTAIPWTPYCLKHEKELEIVKAVRTPTL
jgi:RNA polymerase-binding transcription factor